MTSRDRDARELLWKAMLVRVSVSVKSKNITTSRPHQSSFFLLGLSSHRYIYINIYRFFVYQAFRQGPSKSTRRRAALEEDASSRGRQGSPRDVGGVAWGAGQTGRSRG